MIQVKKLSFKYFSKKVLEDVSIDIREGEIVLVEGKNGSGKSTLLKILSGIIPYRYGSIKVFGKELNEMSIKEKAKMFSYAPQHFSKNIPIPVKSYLEMGLWFIDGNKNGDWEYIVKFFGLDKLLDREVWYISEGEARLCLLARTFLKNSPFVFLDEPETFLDKENLKKLIEIISFYNLKKKTTILIVSHREDMEKSLNITKKIILEGGRAYVQTL